MDVFITIVSGAAIFLLVALALMADTMIWNMPPYGRFKSLVEALEHAEVERIISPYDSTAHTLGRIGRRRIPEIFQTAAPVPDGVTIRQCFGAIFFKDESINETVWNVRISAAVVLFVAGIGLIVVLTQNPHLGDQVAGAALWHRVPMLAEALATYDLIMLAEIAAILTGLLYLIHNGRLIGKLVNAFEAD